MKAKSNVDINSPQKVVTPKTLPSLTNVKTIAPATAVKAPTNNAKSENVSKTRLAISRFMSRIPTALVLAICMLGACAIAKFVLINQSLRLDESQSLWQASHTIHGLLFVVAEDVHVPLYHLILHFWISYFGASVVSVRILSLIFFLVSIPAFYALAKQILSRNWALFATIVFSFSPFMNWYANEARMYTLLVLMAILSQYFFIKIVKENKGWYGWGITALIGAYSHYFFLFNLATQGIYFIFNYKKFPRHTLWKMILVAALVIAELTPWLLYFHSLGSGSNTSPHLAKPSTVDFFNAYSQFLYGFQDDRVNTILVSCWPLLVLVALFAVKRGQKLSLATSYIITVTVVPVVLAFALSLIITPFFLSRYMISSVPALIIILIWFFSHYPRRFAYAACAGLILVLSATSYIQDTSAQNPEREDYSKVAATVSAEANPDDLVVLSAPFTVYPFEYYYHGNAQIATLPIWDQQVSGAIPAFSQQKLPGEVNTLKANHKYIYLVLSQNQGYETNIAKYFETHFARSAKITYSPDLTLYVYQVGYNQVPPLGVEK